MSNGSEYGLMHGMMGDWISPWFWGLASIPGLLTWLALLTFLILGSLYFWERLKKNKE